MLFAGERAADKKDVPAARKFFERATVAVRPTDYRGWTRLGQLAADEGLTRRRAARWNWSKGVASVNEYDMELVLPLAATLIQLKLICRRRRTGCVRSMPRCRGC